MQGWWKNACHAMEFHRIQSGCNPVNNGERNRS